MSFINWGNESPEQLKIRRALDERFLFEQASYNAAMAAAAAAAGSSGTRPGSIQFVVDTTDYLEFSLEFTSTNAPINFTIDWGDGTIHEDSGAGGPSTELHTYEEIGEYTVTVTFDKPRNILELNFAGSSDDYANLIEITNLQNLKNLQEFRADYNSLVNVNLSGLTNLTWVDISDCDRINSVSSSLTGVNLTGCTGLIELRLDDSDFSGGIPNLTGLSSLEWIDMDQCGITGSINLSSISSLKGFDLSGNSAMTEVIISSTQSLGDGQDVNLFSCALTQQSVDNILVTLSNNGVSNGYVQLEGGTNAIPSATGLAAKEVLEGRGWSVDVNLPHSDLIIPASTDFDITGDFTIEMFVNFNQLNIYGTSPRPYSFGAFPTAANAISFQTNQIIFWANSGQRSVGVFAPTLGQWYHICAMRTSGNIDLFIDGVNVASNPYPDPIPSQSLPLAIGYGNEPNSSLNGFISNFRWSSAAIYDAEGFIPPTDPLTNLEPTKLLIFQGMDLNSILTDNSGNGHNATGTSSFAYSSNDPFNSASGSLQVGTV